MSCRIQALAPVESPITSARLQEAAEAALGDRCVRDGWQLNIVLSDDECVRRLNRQHRGIDAVTDVLSFPAAPLPEAIIDDLPCLGDIVIAHGYAADLARRAGVDAESALCLLVAHGVLHLLGHDHDCDSSRRRMWRAQAEALESLGIDPAITAKYGASGDDTDVA